MPQFLDALCVRADDDVDDMDDAEPLIGPRHGRHEYPGIRGDVDLLDQPVQISQAPQFSSG